MVLNWKLLSKRNITTQCSYRKGAHSTGRHPPLEVKVLCSSTLVIWNIDDAFQIWGPALCYYILFSDTTFALNVFSATARHSLCLKAKMGISTKGEEEALVGLPLQKLHDEMSQEIWYLILTKLKKCSLGRIEPVLKAHLAFWNVSHFKILTAASLLSLSDFLNNQIVYKIWHDYKRGNSQYERDIFWAEHLLSHLCFLQIHLSLKHSLLQECTVGKSI